VTLGYATDHEELARSAAGIAGRYPAGTFTAALWRDLGELGVLALATPEGGGDAAHVAAVCEALGAQRCPALLVPALMAAQLVDGPERSGVLGGARVATVAPAGDDLVPWGEVADVFVVLDGNEAWLATPAAPLDAVATLANEPWARGRLDRVRPLPGAARAGPLGDLALAAWLVGAAGALLQRATGHAATRRQFGRVIGDFQAVAHRLAGCDAAVESARALVRLVALQAGGPLPAHAAAARLTATQGALDTAYAAHQVFGAIGYTVDGGIAQWSTAIRQASLLAPGPARAAAMLGGAGGPVSFFTSRRITNQAVATDQGGQQ
jgi:alkylation response protein AidB-like acyl-CoA dehydrogenase